MMTVYNGWADQRGEERESLDNPSRHTAAPTTGDRGFFEKLERAALAGPA
jgi:hypothetical protein